MKRKIISLVLILGVIFCLTGCKGKNQVLTCTKTDIIRKEMRIYSYENGMLKSAIGKFYYDESSMSDEFWKEMKRQAKENNHYCGLSNNTLTYEEPKNCKQSFGNKKILAVNVYDVEKILESYAKEWFSTYEAAKETFTDLGYTCK